MALIVLLFLLELRVNVRAFRPPVRTARRCGPDRTNPQRREKPSPLWVFAGATRTRPQTIVRPTHSRTRAKLTGPGHVHRKHLHRSKHACRCVLWCR